MRDARRPRSARFGRALVAAVAASSLALAACGGSSDKKADASGEGGATTTTAAAQLTALGKQLPEAIQKSGVIKVCSDIAYAPMEFYKEGTKDVQGVDPGIAQAMGKSLGVNFVFESTTFDAILDAVKTGRCDIGMSSITDTKERQAKGISFVDYFTAGTSILVKKGNPDNIKSLDDLCGKTIGLQRGTTQEDQAKAQAEKCKASGKTLTIQTFDKDTEALQQLKVGRTSADLNDSPVAAYNAQTSEGSFEVVGTPFETAPYGIAVVATNTQLLNAIQAALKAAITDGGYDAVLKQWNVQSGALTTAQINGATS